MTNKELLNEIEVAFPVMEMPKINDIPFHKNNCPQCSYLSQDLEVYRHKVISEEVIRSIHQDLSHLSAKAWLWILPYYLKYSLTSEAEYNFNEIEFLVYALSPYQQYEQDTSERLSLLTKVQLDCTIHFLEWCLDRESMLSIRSDINKAIDYLNRIKNQ